MIHLLLLLPPLALSPPASPRAVPDLRVATLRTLDDAPVLTVASTSGGAQLDLDVGALEVVSLPNGNLIVLEPGGGLSEFRGTDGLRVWGLPDAAVESFALLSDGRLAVTSTGGLQLLDRLGDRREVDAAGPLWPGSRLLTIPANTGLLADELQRLGPDSESGATERLLVHRGTGHVEDVDPKALSSRRQWAADALRHPVATGTGWAGVRADGALVAIHMGGSDRAQEETILTPAAIRALGLEAVLTVRPVLTAGTLATAGWAIAGPRLDGAAGLVAVELGPDLQERRRLALPGAYQCWILDAGPETATLERARALHAAALTLDTHKDISASLASAEAPDDPAALRRFIVRNDPRVWGRNQVDFPKMRSGGLDVAFFIVYVGQGDLTAEAFARARAAADAKFDAIERMAGRFPDEIGLARSAADVERIAGEGRLVACIGIENGYAMGEDLSAIAEFHARGARYMSLTHNRHSQLGDSNTPADAPLHGGLSDLGRRAIEEMNRVGIMVDISHASEQTSLQAIAHSRAPVLASHSGVDAILPHGRNLSDAELDALKANDGVIQCVAFASYVKGDGDRRGFIQRTREELGLPPQEGTRPASEDADVRALNRQLRDRVRAFDQARIRANVRDFADHIDHAVQRIGVDHVAISSDFDGGGGIEGWSDASQTFNVTLELVRRGYSAEDIEKIWSGNTLRVWRAVERVAAGAPAREGGR
ncbi:MAG: dipeptidase [Planctomycetota bacterium]|nr:dipeptidase [Planctomycetota bacterium]